jgi:hypothetical protein
MLISNIKKLFGLYFASLALYQQNELKIAPMIIVTCDGALRKNLNLALPINLNWVHLLKQLLRPRVKFFSASSMCFI